MKDYEGAKNAADSAISWALENNRKLAYTANEYYNLWTSNEPNMEDIFTLAINEAESYGMTSIGFFYGPESATYGGRLSPQAKNKLESGDIRNSIIEQDKQLANGAGYRAAKYNGPVNGSVSNIHAVRLSELYLILAECYNELGEPDLAKTALLNIAKRNPSITSEADIDTKVQELETKTLAKFISDERVRELMFEGHRWMDMRRTGEKLSKEFQVNSTINFKDFDVQTFVFPIPSDEINASGLPQNNLIRPKYEL
jgi:hypothetical protein